MKPCASGSSRRSRRTARPRSTVRKAIAQTIAEDAAPLGVRATLASAHRAHDEGDQAAIEQLIPEIVRLFGTTDAAEGVQSLVERRKAVFTGR